MAERNRSRSGNSSNAGCLFWLALILVVLFLFLLNLGRIQETLERTNFRDIMQTQRDSGGGGEPSSRSKPAPKVEPSLPAVTTTSLPARQGGAAAKPGATTTTTTSTTPPRDPAVTTTTSLPKTPAGGQSGGRSEGTGKETGAVSPAAAPRSREASLFFIHIDDDGIMVRREVKRRVTASDSPLRDALLALLAGPTAEEIGKGLISLMPKGTSLLSVQVRGATAWINLSEAFMYNNYGVEGYAGQLKQLVYTATSFPNVQDVQVLIDGEKRDYLGGEGVFIGRPLSRNSF